MKKNITTFFIFLLIIFLGFFAFIKSIEASNNKKLDNLKQEKNKLLNKGFEKLFLKQSKKSKIEQKEFYEKLIKKFEIFIVNYKQKVNLDKDSTFKKIISVDYKNNLKEINFIILDESLEEIKNHNNKIILKKINFKKSQTLILKFDNNLTSINSVILKNKKNILNNISVFIFRKNSNLNKKNINIITEKLKKINKNILIFIDQEGGLINRYIDFENKKDIDIFFIKNNNKYLFLNERLNKLNSIELQIIRNIFPKNSGFYPSLETIGRTYDKFKNKENAEIFLQIIAFIRLQSLKDNGINTYGLVLDLNRGNPVITGNSRSFSKHLWKYKILTNAFLKAGKNTEILIYAKHFPGHGVGKIDSHKGVLNLRGQEKYLRENLDLFDYFLENSGKLQTGLMVGHMYIPNSLRKKYNSIINKTYFLLTDDLAMKGYSQSKGKKLEKQFFTTDKIIKKNNLIIVDTVNIGKIK